MNIRNLLLIVCVVTTGLSMVSAQSSHDFDLKVELDIIKNGLVVRVKTNGAKIKLLSKQLQVVDDDKVRIKLVEEIESYKQEDILFFKELKQAFAKNYKQGPYCFVADSVFQSFMAGKVELCQDAVTKVPLDVYPKRLYAVISERDRERLRFVDHQMLQPNKPIPHKAYVWFGFSLTNRQKYLNQQISSFNKKINKLSYR